MAQNLPLPGVHYTSGYTGGYTMLGFIVRLISSFEKEHGFRPNLLYINRTHCQHLKDAFDETFTFSKISELLQMEIIVEPEAMHPRVAWTQVANRVAS